MGSHDYSLDFELYRSSSLGKSLIASLDELVSNGTFSPLLAMEVMKKFDQSVNRSFASGKVKTKKRFTGHLHMYRFVDDVWTFVLENAQFKFRNGETVDVPDRVKIVASSAQIFLPPEKQDGKSISKTKKARTKKARTKKADENGAA